MIGLLAVAPVPVQAPKILYGFSAHIEKQDRATWDLLASLGGNVVRVDGHWQAVEPKKGVYDWSELDDRVGRGKGRTLRSIVVLGFSNRNYTSTAFDPPLQGEARSAYLKFCRMVALRYPNAIFEVWNEPDNKQFWTNPDPVAYAKLCQDVVKNVRSVNAKAIVWGGSIADVAQTDFLRRAVSAGMLKGLNAVAIHPYGSRMPGEGARTTPEAALARLLPPIKAIVGKVPLAFTEWGWDEAWIVPDPRLGDLPSGASLLEENPIEWGGYYQKPFVSRTAGPNSATPGYKMERGASKLSGVVVPGTTEGPTAVSVWLRSTQGAIIRFGIDDGACLAVKAGPEWKQYSMIDNPTKGAGRLFQAYSDGGKIWEIAGAKAWAAPGADLKDLIARTQEDYRRRSVPAAQAVGALASLWYTLTDTNAGRFGARTPAGTPKSP